MHRGILHLTKEELVELMRVLKCSDSVLNSKLMYANERLEGEVKSISVSEEELELILDEIMPVDKDNTLLQSVFEKISEQLRGIRGLSS